MSETAQHVVGKGSESQEHATAIELAKVSITNNMFYRRPNYVGPPRLGTSIVIILQIWALTHLPNPAEFVRVARGIEGRTESRQNYRQVIV